MCKGRFFSDFQGTFPMKTAFLPYFQVHKLLGRDNVVQELRNGWCHFLPIFLWFWISYFMIFKGFIQMELYLCLSNKTGTCFFNTSKWHCAMMFLYGKVQFHCTFPHAGGEKVHIVMSIGLSTATDFGTVFLLPTLTAHPLTGHFLLSIILI